MRLTVIIKYVLATTIMLTSSVYADNTANTTKTLKSYHNIDTLAKRINMAYEYINLYIMQTGLYLDTNVTKSNIKINMQTGDEIWKSYHAGVFDFSIENDSRIVFTSVLGDGFSAETRALLSINKKLHPLAIFDNNVSLDSLSIPLKTKTYLYIKQIKHQKTSNVIISVTEPADVIDASKLWYKPNGEGGFEVYAYKEGRWQKLSDVAGGGSIQVVDTKPELDALVGSKGDIGYVGTVNDSDKYIYDGSQWLKEKVENHLSNSATQCVPAQLGSMQYNSAQDCMAYCSSDETWVCL